MWRNMYTICWSPKGGSGTTVVASTIALSHEGPHTLIDLAGDLPAVLGLNDTGRGLFDALSDPGAITTLDDVSTPIDEHHSLIRRGSDHVVPPQRWHALALHLASTGSYTIDAGTVTSPDDLPMPLVQHADQRLMVLRPCYLALRRARLTSDLNPDGIVLIDEPGRSLSAHDVSNCLDTPVIAQIPCDPRVARAVDAGLLAIRPPRSLDPLSRL